MARVLLVEDDGVIARSMSAHLRHAGHDVEWVEDGERALKKLRFERPDVIVIDLMLPSLDGWALTEQARREGILTPIIVVSARGSEHDKVHALGIGADDYLAKPFGMRELVARVAAALRRSQIAPVSTRHGPIEVPGLVIDPDQQRAFLVDDEGTRTDAQLTPTEFRLLLVLAENAGRAMSRDELQQRVWNVPHRPRDRSVDVCVRKLREKVDNRSTHSYLKTHFGVGYRFAPEPSQVLLGRSARAIFDLLEDATRNLVFMSGLCADLYDRFPEAGDRVVRIREAEDEGDRITRELYEALHRTFATPLPRGHLLSLSRALDDVADAIEEAATELELVGVQSVPERARAQARVVLHACERLADAVERLRDRPNLEGEVADIYALEDEGDQIVRDALARLFASGAEPLEIVRTKTLHDRLEQAVDSTKAAGAALERIAVTTR